MNILDAIVTAGEGRAVTQLASQFGLGEEQAASALSALVPALTAGFQRNLQSPEGLGSLVSALAQGGHQQYLENPAILGDERAVADGNGILAHVLGSKDVSREVASRAAAQTGLGADVMKRLLPLAATLMMGAFARQTTGSSASGAAAAGSGSDIPSMLTSLLDADRDGSVADDVAGLVGRVLGRS
jgi:hypothetical protein